MSTGDEDDKPTVVLDLNALKKQKIEEAEKLASFEEEIQFDVLAKQDETNPEEDLHSSVGAKVILFDFQSNFFEESISHFPEGFEYIMANNLEALNNCLRSKEFQIVVMNYDVNAKAVNQLSAQIKQKFPSSKVLIVARAISPEKVKIHAKTPSGAAGYYQLPIETRKLEKEFSRIIQNG